MGSSKNDLESDTDALGFKPSLIPIRPQDAVPGQDPEDEYYNMSHSNRGIALIFNHQYFDSPFNKERKGTEFDRDAIQGVLKKIGFHVEVYEDYSREKIMETLQIVSKMDHTENDCLVVAVMSHGRTNGRISAKDKEYTSGEMLEFFAGDKCPSLAGKPKLFFIQACRGDKTDPGVRIEKDSQNSEANRIIYSIPAMADILIMYATVEGYYAWRDPKSGGCFIQSLARKLEAHHANRDLLSILTIVNREVAVGFESNHFYQELDKKKMMCSIVSMLTRLLRFD
ncbi:unnamed protein product [Ceutorhynchus assimilis]|uniref:Caspase-3 n=1 Tax=Ceutorhynchus assimilis TaxID=467358 RepID=A0A9N9MME6_9CUCU|nr:unnamed protein product [Ceutorhynchus assimilis]